MKSFQILCVSDVHLSISNIQNISQWIKENNKTPDFIFCSGDIANLKGEEYNNKESVTKSIGNIKKKQIKKEDVFNILLELEKICPKCFFIPGNV
jgi:Icc-related predicted phosphoesterase